MGEEAIAEPARAARLTPADSAAGLRACGRRSGLRALLCAAVALPFLVSSYRVFQFNMVLVYAIVLLGLNILTGYNGQISLGHGAFYAIGAYVAAILMEHFGWPYWATLPVGGRGVLRFRFSVRTAGAAPARPLPGTGDVRTGRGDAADPQVQAHRALDRRRAGYRHHQARSAVGLKITPDQWLYLFTLAIVVVMFVVGWNLLRGRVGRALVAIRDHPIAAEAMGVNSALYKTLTFGVSALFTGVAGALGAIVVQFVAPDSFTGGLSINFLIGIVIGGIASISGAFYGALFIQFVPNFADQISKAAPWAIYGVFLLRLSI